MVIPSLKIILIRCYWPYEFGLHLRARMRQGAAEKGYLFVRQTGSHIIIRRTDPFSQITVPDHKELDRGTLRAIVRQVSLSIVEFNSLL
jgi:predicted RNA binding protein YcfA (HicA-like mRNA interferase family)